MIHSPIIAFYIWFSTLTQRTFFTLKCCECMFVLQTHICMLLDLQASLCIGHSLFSGEITPPSTFDWGWRFKHDSELSSLWSNWGDKAVKHHWTYYTQSSCFCSGTGICNHIWWCPGPWQPSSGCTHSHRRSWLHFCGVLRHFQWHGCKCSFGLQKRPSLDRVWHMRHLCTACKKNNTK